MERCPLSKNKKSVPTKVPTNNEPKRLKIGVLGGSHAQGAQPYKDLSKKSFFDKFKKKELQPKVLTNSLDFHLSNAMPGFDFYNVAISGRGSERYLSNIVQLLESFSVDVILVDTLANRSFNYFWYDAERVKSIPDDQVAMRLSLMEEKYASYANRTHDVYVNESPLKNCSPKFIKNWNDAVTLLGSSEVFDALGKRDIENVRSLCDRCGVSLVEWSFNDDLKNVLLKTFVKFDTVTSDGHHMNDLAMDWAARNYFAPKIFKQLNVSNE